MVKLVVSADDQFWMKYFSKRYNDFIICKSSLLQLKHTPYPNVMCMCMCVCMCVCVCVCCVSFVYFFLHGTSSVLC
uniref:Uncharacterized protein n=1 Tax=Octopus bimaculoides TaxID=37653 RepID=A0A0L8GFC9_OCTBM